MTSVRFYDNDINHIYSIEELCPDIESIHVPEIPISWEYPTNNAYARLIKSFDGETHQPVRGLTDKHIDDIMNWSEKMNDINIKPIIIFDWDRTLTQVEGFTSPGLEGRFWKRHGIQFGDVVQYLVGGGERLNLLQMMDAHLVINNADIYVLTNNTACFLYPDVFYYLVEEVLPSIRSQNILCSGMHKYKNKGDFLQQHSIFNKYCYPIDNLDYAYEIDIGEEE